MLKFLFKKEVSSAELLNDFYSKLREMYSFESISDERKDYLKSTMAKYGYLPYPHIKALEELRKNGILVFLATGRHFTEIHDLKMDHIAFDGYVMLTGQLCTDGEKNVIFGNAIKPEMADYLFNAFETKELPLMMVEKDSLYVNMVNEVVEKAQEGISSPVPPVGEYNGAPIIKW